VGFVFFLGFFFFFFFCFCCFGFVVCFFFFFFLFFCFYVWGFGLGVKASPFWGSARFVSSFPSELTQEPVSAECPRMLEGEGEVCGNVDDGFPGGAVRRGGPFRRFSENRRGEEGGAIFVLVSKLRRNLGL